MSVIEERIERAYGPLDKAIKTEPQNFSRSAARRSL